MINKTAVIKAAQKFAAKGHIDKAISEWEKLLKDRKDGNVYNTIGDLYLRKSADQEAKESFTKAAEIFRKDGFYPKAIAIYKKVLNIAPNDVDALIALAKLNADKGLTGNAIDNYYRAAEMYNKNGSTEKATMVVEKMLQLSPSDISTRSKIAYLYFRIGLREKAANEYASIALTYLEQDKPKKAKEYFDKAFEYDPGNVSTLVGRSRLSLMENNHDEAFKSLDVALSQDPSNKQILLAYAKLAIDLNKKDDAKKALALLADIDPSSMDTKKLVGTLHLKDGLNENAWQELQPVIDNALDGEKWSEAHELLHHFTELYPIPTKERILRITKAQGDEAAICNELKELAALHENEGSSEDALKLYKEALELSPDDNDCNDKVIAIETTLGIAPITTETPAEDQPGVENNTFTTPAYNEVSFSEAETTPEENVSPPHGEAGTFEENIFTPSETGKEEMSIQPEIAPEELPGLETNNVMPAGNSEETDLPREPQTISDDELLAKKAEADFYVQQGLDNEAHKIYEHLLSVFPDNEEIANKLSSLSSAAPQMDDIFIDMEHPASKRGDEIPADTVKADKPTLKTNMNDDLQELFNQFDDTAEERVDYEAHYIAGLEFKQKGVLDKAVKELKIAANDPDKKQRNSTMLALCYMEQGSYSLAIKAFNMVIASMSPSDSTYLHVKYELANAYMQNKEYNKALEFFSEVQAVEPTFKDISSKVDSLKEQTQQKPQQGKKDRVSYI